MCLAYLYTLQLCDYRKQMSSSLAIFRMIILSYWIQRNINMWTAIAQKEMATHSSVLAWRIPGTGEPDGLPSMGSHRVGHDWSDLTAAAAAATLWFKLCVRYTNAYYGKYLFTSFYLHSQYFCWGISVIMTT